MKKIILSFIIFILGFCWLFWYGLMNEDNLVDIVLDNVDYKELGEIFGFDIPKDLKIEKMTTNRTFVDDQLQTVMIYSNYSEQEWDKLLNEKWQQDIFYGMDQEKNVLRVSFFDDKLGLGSFVLKNGEEDRREYNIQLVKRIIVIILLMSIPWINNVKVLSSK